MKKDIPFPKVEDTVLAVVPEEAKGERVWNAYIVNLKEEPITGLLIATRGYGKRAADDVKTSVLRHFFERLGARSFAKIERITEELRDISNEFWVSFYYRSQIYDKRYVFLAESITEDNLIQVPVLGKPGVVLT